MFWMPIVFAYVTLHTDGPGGSGPELKWRQAQVPFAYNAAGSTDLSSGSEFQVIESSFQTWNDACPVNYTSHGFTTKTAADDFTNGTPVNGNEKTDGSSTINWLESGWPYGSPIIGITFTWFASDGTIGEADMLLNGQDYSWTDGDTGVQTDEQSIVTHEAGHYLGMAHSPDTEATMFATVGQGETKKRDLDPDDIAGARHLYPNAFGDQTPRACGCRLDGGAPSSGLVAGVLGLLALAGFAFASRRRGRAASRLAALAVLALGVGIAPSARATVMLDLPLDRLAASSDTVVLGTVASVQTVTDGVTIHTDQTIVVTQTLAGADAGTEITVRTPGGLLPAGVTGPGGYAGMIADGVPRFTRGEELVLFLRKIPVAGEVFAVNGFDQGKMIVVRDGKTGEGRLYRDLSGSLRVVKTPEGDLEPAPADDPLAGMTLDGLAARLSTLPVGTAR